MFVALAVNAQTQTEDPVINYSYDEITNTGIIEIYDEDPDAEIFWSFCNNYGSDWTEWMVYSEPVCFTEMGQYTVRAFAISPDKEASDICEFYFVIEESSIYQAYDFIVDGIYYSGERCSEGEVWVSTEYMEFPLNWVLPHAYTQCYHDDVVVPSTVEYEGKTYTVTGIGENAFDNCDVSSVTLPNTITTLYHGAFWSASLKQLTIPSSVTFIGDFAFDCPYLTKIVCMGTTPSQIIDGYMWLVNIIGQATLFVPQESLEAYRGHDEWGKFSRIVPFIGAGPGDVDGDGAIAIDDVTSLIDLLLNGGELPAYVDVDGDGTVDISDVTELIDMLLGVN
jgi:hypothetical protein